MFLLYFVVFCAPPWFFVQNCQNSMIQFPLGSLYSKCQDGHRLVSRYPLFDAVIGLDICFADSMSMTWGLPKPWFRVGKSSLFLGPLDPFLSFIIHCESVFWQDTSDL